MSGVNAEILKLLFPAFVQEITLKAGEQRTAALLSGKATASDIAAGVAFIPGSLYLIATPYSFIAAANISYVCFAMFVHLEKRSHGQK